MSQVIPKPLLCVQLPYIASISVLCNGALEKSSVKKRVAPAAQPIENIQWK